MALHQAGIRDIVALGGCAAHIYTSKTFLHNDRQDESMIHERLLGDCLDALVDLLDLRQVVVGCVKAEVGAGIVHVALVVVPHGDKVEPLAFRRVLRPVATVACV